MKKTILFFRKRKIETFIEVSILLGAFIFLYFNPSWAHYIPDHIVNTGGTVMYAKIVSDSGEYNLGCREDLALEEVGMSGHHCSIVYIHPPPAYYIHRALIKSKALIWISGGLLVLYIIIFRKKDLMKDIERFKRSQKKL
jgi:hypothetical protein